MLRHNLIALSNVVDDRDDDYKWYDTVQRPGVVGLPCLVSSMRYSIGAPLGGEDRSDKYVVIHDTESDDADSVLQGLTDAVPTMTVTESFDPSSVVTSATALGAPVGAP